jgi:hypothetical protein
LASQTGQLGIELSILAISLLRICNVRSLAEELEVELVLRMDVVE